MNQTELSPAALGAARIIVETVAIPEEILNEAEQYVIRKFPQAARTIATCTRPEDLRMPGLNITLESLVAATAIQIERATALAHLLDFVSAVACMTTEEEMEDCMPSDDAIATMNSLIVNARKITGIDPKYPKVNPVEEM